MPAFSIGTTGKPFSYIERPLKRRLTTLAAILTILTVTILT